LILEVSYKQVCWLCCSKGTQRR